eukprot:TRINITY_DN13285_c0_g1_i1.p1 TRINITY_DN13285_c0_g1~~TRINITY_DN13285_c0_g1_i1.p1  ORF type:complete len:325 (+),score=142.51 TRINITY_DN13285_c0_g1_i1:84-1058(+)
MLSFCPSKDAAVKVLKQLGSAAMGMVAALALNEAMSKTADELFDAAVVVYAILISMISIAVLALIKLKLEGWASSKGGERGKALTALFKVSFCLLSASAWQEVIEGEGVTGDDVWKLLGIAIGLTVGLIVILIIVFKLYDFWQNAACRSGMHWLLSGFINGTLVGLVMWTPLTFGIVNGIAWNAFFEALIFEIFGDGGGRVVAAFVYAFLTIPLAIGVILLTAKVSSDGWGSCCPGPVKLPCCGLDNRVSEALVAMFEGEASAIMAFAWNSAFRTLWNEMADTDPSPNGDGSDEPGEIGIIIAYAIVATIVGIAAVLISKKCAD